MKNDCVFCAIAEGEIPSFKVYEDDLVLAYLDINPFSEGHTLVIPKAHFTGLLDTPPDLRTQCLLHKIPSLDGVLLSHDHTDHLSGFDDLRPYSRRTPDLLPVFASPATAA